MRPSLKSVDGKGKNMWTRETVRQHLIDLGVSEPSEDAITNFLNVASKEIKNAKDEADRNKASAARVKELEEQLDTLNSQNMTEVEKANKATEDALKQVSALKKTVMQMQRAKELAEIGIVGDEAEAMFNEDGSLNVSKLGEIITGREKTAVANFEKDALLKTPNPEGGKPDNDDDKGDPIVNDVVKSVAESVKAKTEAASIVDSYK